MLGEDWRGGCSSGPTIFVSCAPPDTHTHIHTHRVTSTLRFEKSWIFLNVCNKHPPGVFSTTLFTLPFLPEQPAVPEVSRPVAALVTFNARRRGMHTFLFFVFFISMKQTDVWTANTGVHMDVPQVETLKFTVDIYFLKGQSRYHLDIKLN